MKSQLLPLLLILTPYVIQGQQDLRKVFERKMQERQEFIDRYFVFHSDWEPPRDWTRANGLVEEIRQSNRRIAERLRLEEESRPREERLHEPTASMELPGQVRMTTGTRRQAATAAPQQQQKRPTKAKPKRKTPKRNQPKRNRPPRLNPQQRPQPAQRREGGVSPIRINPVARSVNVERVE